MGAVPSPVNSTAAAVNTAIQVAVFDVALKSFQTYARAQLPWLNFPIISPLFNYLCDKIGTCFYTFLAQIATFSIIDMQTAAEKSAYSQALLALQAAYTKGDPNAIAQATASTKTALASLIRFDGSTPIHLKLRKNSYQGQPMVR